MQLWWSTGKSGKARERSCYKHKVQSTAVFPWLSCLLSGKKKMFPLPAGPVMSFSARDARYVSSYWDLCWHKWYMHESSPSGLPAPFPWSFPFNFHSSPSTEVFRTELMCWCRIPNSRVYHEMIISILQWIVKNVFKNIILKLTINYVINYRDRGQWLSCFKIMFNIYTYIICVCVHKILLS